MPAGSTLADAYVRIRGDGSVLGPDVRAATVREAGVAGDAAGKTFGERMRAALAASAVGAGIVGALLVKGVRDSIAASRDLAETQSKIRVIFGDNAAAIEAFGDTAARSMGQSKQTALDGAAAFATYGRQAGLTGASVVDFSTKLVVLASDVASFSNADPAAVISDFGSAMRGEFDPIEKYGVLLSESTVKQRALSMGIISTTTSALTPQQRVLAVQAEIFAQTGKAQGDFARTSEGLANQQRILAAQMDNLKTTIGNALLPVAVRLVTFMNDRVVPVFQDMAVRHGPAISAVFANIGAFIARMVDEAAGLDWAQMFADGRAAIVALGPAVSRLKDETPALSDTLRVSGVVMRFMADHADTLGKMLPWLVGGFVLLKIATVAANVAAALTPALTLAQIIVSNRLAASNLQLAAATTAQTAAVTANTVATTGNVVAENVGIATKARATIASAAHRIAVIASTIATAAMTAATTALGVAMNFALGPVGLVILGITALIGIVVLAYKNNETFRNIVDKVWRQVRETIAMVVDWFVNVAWPALKRVYDAITSATQTSHDAVVRTWSAVRNAVGSVVDWVVGKMTALGRVMLVDIPNAFRAGADAVGSAWNQVREAAAAPIRFVVDTVINQGVIHAFNVVAGALGVNSRIGRVSIPFAEGGPVRGPGGPKDDVVPAWLSNGEYVIPAKIVRQVGVSYFDQLIGRSTVDRPGDGSEGLAFAEGGFVGNLLGGVKGLWDSVSNPVAWVRGKMSGLLGGIPGGGVVREVAVGMGGKLIDSLGEWIKSAVGADTGGAGGTGLPGTVGAAQAFIRAQAGKPYIWAAAGPRGYDCSGIVSSVWNILHGKNPHSHTFSTHIMNRFFTKPGRGLFTAGWSHAGERGGGSVGHTAAELAGLRFESSGGRGVSVGPSAKSVESFARFAHYRNGGLVGARLFDQGGAWPTGTLGVNLSGRTEQVTPANTMDEVVDRLDRVISALEALPAAFGSALTGGVYSARQLARGRA